MRRTPQRIVARKMAKSTLLFSYIDVLPKWVDAPAESDVHDIVVVSCVKMACGSV